MLTLRPYQQKTIQDLYDWFRNHEGHPVINLPTGAGKSVIIAELCRDALQSWPDTKILMITHVRELIEQNVKKLREHWPNAPIGIFSAGLNRRELSEPITFAGIQSIRDKAYQIGHIDLCLVDEAHLISHKEEGGYRNLIDELTKINPHIRIIGLTASPYRLGHGLITEEPALFTDIIEPVTIEQLQYQGYLSKLISKVTSLKLVTDGVHKRGGDYIESELQKAVDTQDQNDRVVIESIKWAGDRKHWLFFCTGVEHSEHVRDVLKSKGILAECVTGKTPKEERDRIINDFKSGKIKALTNANILTTGFDFPDIDLIVMMRPTMSPGLYLQQAGRGLRLKSHTDHCLVLDFAGVVETHGPITAVKPPRKAGEGDGVPPCKICPNCDSIVHASVKHCPDCNHEFKSQEKDKEEMYLRDVDIMGKDSKTFDVGGWHWSIHVGKQSGKEMFKVEYMGTSISDRPIQEYFVVFHEGYAGIKAVQNVKALCEKSGIDFTQYNEASELLNDLNYKGKWPSQLLYKKDGKFFKVIDRVWGDVNKFYDDEIPF